MKLFDVMSHFSDKKDNNMHQNMCFPSMIMFKEVFTAG